MHSCWLCLASWLVAVADADPHFVLAFLHRGGLIFWADLVGANKIAAKLDALAKMVGVVRSHPAFYATICSSLSTSSAHAKQEFMIEAGAQF